MRGYAYSDCHNEAGAGHTTMSGTISESTGIKLTAGKAIGCVVTILLAGWGAREWMSRELLTQEKSIESKMALQKEYIEERFATKESLLASELAQTRALQAILSEVRRSR